LNDNLSVYIYLLPLRKMIDYILIKRQLQHQIVDGSFGKTGIPAIVSNMNGNVKVKTG